MTREEPSLKRKFSYLSNSSDDDVKKKRLDGEKVYFINYLECCEKDIDELCLIFKKMDYEIIFLDKIGSYDEVKAQIDKDRSKIVFFFGFGFNDFLYLGDDIVSYEEFGKMFDLGSDKSNAIFTNVCIKQPPNEILRQKITPGELTNACHLAVKVHGECDKKESPLSEALLYEFRKLDYLKEKNPLEFDYIANKVSEFIGQKKTKDKTYTVTWYYKYTDMFKFEM